MQSFIKSNFGKICITLFVSLSFLLFAHKAFSPVKQQWITISFVEKDIKLYTQLAATPEDRTRGLSEHETLDDHEAMLFIFDRPGLYGFHMPNMSFPIDIFWLNEHKEIVYIKHNAQPKDYPEVYIPTQPALYVLETVAGFAEQHSIALGEILSW